jgi:hypothetical protein
LLWYCRIPGSNPIVPSATKDRDVSVSECHKPERHTDARFVVLSRTVDDDLLVRCVASFPRVHFCCIEPLDIPDLTVASPSVLTIPCIQKDQCRIIRYHQELFLAAPGYLANVSG